MNTELLVDGLTLSALGLGITFTALALLIGMIILLQLLFNPKPAKQAETPVPTEKEPVSSKEIQKLAVAMAVATCLLQDDLEVVSDKSLGQSLENGHGRWWRRSIQEGKN